jgi:hypothetical protein
MPWHYRGSDTHLQLQVMDPDVTLEVLLQIVDTARFLILSYF